MAAWEAIGITADPGRVHTEGRMARAALEEAREQVAGPASAPAPARWSSPRAAPRPSTPPSGARSQAGPGAGGLCRGRALGGPRRLGPRRARSSPSPSTALGRIEVGCRRRGPRAGAARTTAALPAWSTASGPTTRWAPSSRWPRSSSAAAGSAFQSTSTRWPPPVTLPVDLDATRRRPGLGVGPQAGRPAGHRRADRPPRASPRALRWSAANRNGPAGPGSRT